MINVMFSLGPNAISLGSNDKWQMTNDKWQKYFFKSLGGQTSGPPDKCFSKKDKSNKSNQSNKSNKSNK